MHAFASADAAAPLALTQWHVFKSGRFLAVPSMTIACVSPPTFKMRVRKKGAFKRKKPVLKQIVEGEDEGGGSHRKKGKKSGKPKGLSGKAMASWRGKGEGSVWHVLDPVIRVRFACVFAVKQLTFGARASGKTNALADFIAQVCLF